MTIKEEAKILGVDLGGIRIIKNGLRTKGFGGMGNNKGL